MVGAGAEVGAGGTGVAASHAMIDIAMTHERGTLHRNASRGAATLGNGIGLFHEATFRRVAGTKRGARRRRVRSVLLSSCGAGARFGGRDGRPATSAQTAAGGDRCVRERQVRRCVLVLAAGARRQRKRSHDLGDVRHAAGAEHARVPSRAHARTAPRWIGRTSSARVSITLHVLACIGAPAPTDRTLDFAGLFFVGHRIPAGKAALFGCLLVTP